MKNTGHTRVNLSWIKIGIQYNGRLLFWGPPVLVQMKDEADRKRTINHVMTLLLSILNLKRLSYYFCW